MWIGVKAESTSCDSLLTNLPPALQERLKEAKIFEGIGAYKLPDQALGPLLTEWSRRFCAFEVPEGVTLTQAQVAELAAELGKHVVGLRPDIRILGGVGSRAPTRVIPEDDDRLWSAAGLRGLLESQAVFTRPSVVKPPPFVSVLDDVPFDYLPGHSLSELQSPDPLFGHGLMVDRIIHDVACGDILCPDSPVHTRYLQALPHTSTRGPSGSLSDVSVMLLVAALSPEPNIANMSLGWNAVEMTEKGDPLLLTQYLPMAAALTDPEGQKVLPLLADGPTAMVFWSLLQLSCRGHVAIAGAGNDALLLPAAFGGVPLTMKLCKSVFPASKSTGAADPRVVYTVGGLNYEREWVYPPRQAMTGHEKVPTLSALASASTRTPRGGWQVFTGSSVAAATFSGMLALLWRYDKGTHLHATVESLRTQVNAPQPGALAPRPQLCQAVTVANGASIKCDETTIAEVDQYFETRAETIKASDLPEGPLPWAPVGPITAITSCYKC